MRREIKFRLPWFNDKDNSFSHFSYWGRIDYKNNSSDDCFTAPGSASPFHHKEDQQFTGLLDKKGKEIYEGDIVEDQLTRKYTIEYSVDTCAFKLVKDFDSGNMMDKRGKFVLFDAMNLIVIGNIYENPELIN
jgi:uncharacterized phage protein (TIGR01671 family)